MGLQKGHLQCILGLDCASYLVSQLAVMGGVAVVHLWSSTVGMSPSEKSNSSGPRPGSAHLRSSENSLSSSLGVGWLASFLGGSPKKSPFTTWGRATVSSNKLKEKHGLGWVVYCPHPRQGVTI